MKITLCGSAKFESQFKEANRRLTLAGHVVYSLAVYPSDMGNEKTWYTPNQKTILDEVHLKKIANSEGIYVIAEGGYIGESTAREILYADSLGLDIFSRYPFGKHFQSQPDFKSYNLCKAMIRTCHYAGCPDLLMTGPCGLCYE